MNTYLDPREIDDTDAEFDRGEQRLALELDSPLWALGLEDVGLEARPPGAVASAAAELPTFEAVASTGVPVKSGAWDHPVVIDLAGLVPAKSQIPVRFGHDRFQVIGHCTEINIGPERITATGVLSCRNVHARNVVDAAQNGLKWQMSVGVHCERTEFLKLGETTVVNGRTVTGPAFVTRESVLREISIVDVGSDPGTSVEFLNGATVDFVPEDQEVESEEEMLARVRCKHPTAYPDARMMVFAVREQDFEADLRALRSFGEQAIREAWIYVPWEKRRQILEDVQAALASRFAGREVSVEGANSESEIEADMQRACQPPLSLRELAIRLGLPDASEAAQRAVVRILADDRVHGSSVALGSDVCDELDADQAVEASIAAAGRVVVLPYSEQRSIDLRRRAERRLAETVEEFTGPDWRVRLVMKET